MSGFLKIMSGQDMADGSPFKNYDLYSIAPGGKVSFRQNSTGLDVAVIANPEADSEEVILYGNAYMMSESGKTIASRGTNVPSTLSAEDGPAPMKVAIAAMMCCSSDEGELFKVLDNAGHRYTALYSAMAQALQAAADPEKPILAEGEEAKEAAPATPEYEAKKAIASLQYEHGEPAASPLLSNEALAAQLSLLDFGDITAVLSQAIEKNKLVNGKFTAALGEYLANAAGSDAESAEAVKYAASYLPGVPRTVTEATNRGRGGEYATLGTPQEMADAQNKAASVYWVQRANDDRNG